MKKIIAGIMALCICGGVIAPLGHYDFCEPSINAFADEFTVGTYKGLTYRKYNILVEIVSCDKEAAGEIVIPDTIEGLPVTSIDDKAFKNCSKITSITLPADVMYIDSGTFYGCSSLTAINVSEKDEKYSSLNGVLFNKDKTELIKHPSGKEDKKYVIPNSVTSISSSAFSGCSSLTSITIPNGVTSIGGNAFAGCSGLTSIKLPDSVTDIDYAAFYNCSNLTSINIPDGVTSIGYAAFCRCSNLTSINIPYGIVYIGKDTFKECSSLKSIEIPNSVRSIGESAFENCSSLTSINIPNDVTYIESYVFRGCSALKSIEIPNSVTYIRWGAFYDCTGLTSINIPESVTSMRTDFSSCTSLTAINVSEENEKYSSVDGVLFNKDKTKLLGYPVGKEDEEYIIPDSVTEFYEDPFCNNLKLKKVVIPDNLTNLPTYAFSGCASLTSINVSKNNKEYSSLDGVLFNKDKTKLIKYPGGRKEYIIPDSVTEIGGLSFRYSLNLKAITIPGNVTNIGQGAFQGCTGLTSISFSDGVTKIGVEAFQGCTGLTSITLPESVTKIEGAAFCDCSNLKSFIIKNPECDIEIYATTICNEYIEGSDFGGKFNGTIYGHENSTAQKYAEDNNYKFDLIENAPEEPIIEDPTDKPTDKPTPSTPEETPVTLGDLSGDDTVDASDASMVLVEYAKTSTGGSSSLTEAQKLAADTNKDGSIDASDASQILMFYSYSSTGGTITDMEEWLS